DTAEDRYERELAAGRATGCMAPYPALAEPHYLAAARAGVVRPASGAAECGRRRRSRVGRLGRYVNPFWRERHALRTRLGPQACARMLRNQAEEWASPRALFDVSDRALVGSVSERGFWLAPRPGTVSPFRPAISGHFQA